MDIPWTNRRLTITEREATLLVLIGVGVSLDTGTTIIGLHATPPNVVLREQNPVTKWVLVTHGLPGLVSAKLITYVICCGLFAVGASLVDAQYRWLASLFLTAILGLYTGIIGWNLAQLYAVL